MLFISSWTYCRGRACSVTPQKRHLHTHPWGQNIVMVRFLSFDEKSSDLTFFVQAASNIHLLVQRKHPWSSCLSIHTTLTRFGTLLACLFLSTAALLSHYFLISLGTKASKARPADLQLQAVHREVFSPHHSGWSDVKRERSRSLLADRQGHQREVRQPTHLERISDLFSLANQRSSCKERLKTE